MTDMEQPQNQPNQTVRLGQSPPPPPSDFTIEAGDLRGSEVDERVSHLQEAKNVPLVRAIGDATAVTTDGNRFSWKAVGIMAGAGVLAGFVVFLFWRSLLNNEENTALYSNMMMTFSMVFAIALTVTGVDVARTGSMEKLGRTMLLAVPVALGSALVLGFSVHLFYTSATEGLIEAALNNMQYQGWSEQRAFDYVMTWMHPVRGLAWGGVGAAVGLTIGVSSRTIRRTVITTIGGFVGGFLGGFLFDFIAVDESSEAAAQLVGVVLTGLLIGLSIAVLEEGRKASWIEIKSGGMAGKQFILYQDIITIGSSPSCNITVIKDPAVPQTAAVITRSGNQAQVAGRGNLIDVDGRMQERSALHDGSVITLGGTVLIYREKSAKQTEIGAVRR